MSLANRPFAEDDGVPITEFLLLDEQQLLPFVNTLPQPFDPSSVFSGFMELSDSQKHEFADRVLKVYELLGWALDEGPDKAVDVNDLDARLQKVADARTGSPDPRWLSQSFKSNATPSVSSDGPAVLDKAVPMYEVAAHRALVKDGARPVCSLEEMAQIRAAPSERYKDVLAWLTEDPDFEPAEYGVCPAYELRDMFYRQWKRWCWFRKTQWISRGLGDSEAGVRAYCEAEKSRNMDSGTKVRISSPEYTEFLLFDWRRMPREKLRPLEDETFATYSNAARSRIALYQFKKPMQLKKDPLKQTAWTNWLEYLNYELRWLEERTAAADALESRYQEHTKKLRDAVPPEGYDRDAPASTNSEPMDLAAARARLDASQDAIRNFLQKTARYTKRRNRAFYQRHRVEWIVKEARLMEAEMAQQSGAGTKRKRKQDEDPAESQQQPPQKMAAPAGPRRSARLGVQRGKPTKV